jgi:hypothetical protein
MEQFLWGFEDIKHFANYPDTPKKNLFSWRLK